MLTEIGTRMNSHEIWPGLDMSLPVVTNLWKAAPVGATVTFHCPACGLHTGARLQRQGFVTVQQKATEGGLWLVEIESSCQH